MKIFFRSLQTLLFFIGILFLLGVQNIFANQKLQNNEQFSYSELLGLFPADTSILRGLAKVAKKRNDHSRTMIFLEQLTVYFPLEKELWKDLAEAYTALGNTEAAKKALERAENQDGFAKKIFALTDLYLQAEAGVFHDDNLYFQPPQKIIRLHPRVTYDLRDEKYKAKLSWGKYAGGTVKINQRFTPQGAWSIVADLGYRIKSYNKFNPKSTTSLHLAGGLRHTGDSHDITLQGVREQYEEDFQKKLVQSGMELTLFHQLVPNLWHATKGAFIKRKNQNSQSSDKDATIIRLEESLHLFWRQNEFMLGGSLITNKAKKKKLQDNVLYRTDIYSYNAWQSSVMADFSIIDSLKLRLMADYETRYYNTTPEKYLRFILYREDKRTSIGINLRYFFFNNFYLESEYTHFRNRSNIETFDYDKNVFSSGLRWQF